MADLFEQVLHHLEGEENEIQNWKSETGEGAYSVPSFGPDRWIERAALGRLMAIDVLAVILFCVRDTFDIEQERRIVESWAAELRKAASDSEVQARDPVTLLGLQTPPAEWNWLISISDADKFVVARGMSWKCSEQVKYLLEQTRRSGTRYLDPKSGHLLKHYWLAGYEPQPAPAQTPTTPAPMTALGDEKQSIERIRYEVLASRSQLIEAFGYYGVELKIFKALKDRPGLLAACKVKGRGHKGSRAEPMFCPFEVINWLVKTGVKEKPRLKEFMGWHILETKFQNVYSEKSMCDPRQN